MANGQMQSHHGFKHVFGTLATPRSSSRASGSVGEIDTALLTWQTFLATKPSHLHDVSVQLHPLHEPHLQQQSFRAQRCVDQQAFTKNPSSSSTMVPLFLSTQLTASSNPIMPKCQQISHCMLWKASTVSELGNTEVVLRRRSKALSFFLSICVHTCSGLMPRSMRLRRIAFRGILLKVVAV